MESKPLYAAIAGTLGNIENCKKHDNKLWLERWEAILEKLETYLPSGSGIDAGTQIVGMSGRNLVFQADFHHMDENGFYDGWTEHRVTIKPCLVFGIDVVVSGKDRNGVKDYLGDIFHEVIKQQVNTQELLQEIINDDAE